MSGSYDRNFTEAKIRRRIAQIDTSVACYLDQLDTADWQEPSTALDMKVTLLTAKIGKLRDEMQRLEAIEVRRQASPTARSR